MRRLIGILMLCATFASAASACEKGCSEYQITPNQKVCACDEVTQTGNPVKPSDEKPSHESAPAYEREGLQVDMPKSQNTEEEDAARQRHSYDGAIAAGIK